MALNLTIRAVLWTGTANSVTVANVPRPILQHSNDAIIKVSAAGICGTDLHTYHGTQGAPNPPWTMGHEAIGIVSEIGEAVGAVNVGDKVVVPDLIGLGRLNLGQGAPELELGGFFGGSPALPGCQAEYVRVPFADYTLIPTSNNATSDLDYLFLSDIFATGWQSLDFAGFEPGNSVAIFGAGPVGVMAAYSAKLRGASAVYVIDRTPERLKLAESIGAIPINFADEDPVAAILAKEPGGVTRSVDAVGYEAVDETGTMNSAIVTQQMIAVTAQFGGLGTVGVYVPGVESPGSPLGATINGTITFPIASFFGKNLHWGAGSVDPKILAPQLLDLVSAGKANPSFVVSALIDIEDAPEYYSRFSKQQETKVVIEFK